MKKVILLVAFLSALMFSVAASGTTPPLRTAVPAKHKSQRDLLRSCAHGNKQACRKLNGPSKAPSLCASSPVKKLMSRDRMTCGGTVHTCYFDKWLGAQSVNVCGTTWNWHKMVYSTYFEGAASCYTWAGFDLAGGDTRCQPVGSITVYSQRAFAQPDLINCTGYQCGATFLVHFTGYVTDGP